MASGKRAGGWRRAALAAALALVALPLAACAGRSAYAGIPFAPGAADPEAQTLARRALAGDKQAQLELGIRYEEGRGVPVDLRRAASLYRLAARASGGTLYVYTPPVGKHGHGGLVPVYRGPRRAGLEEARVRLRRLKQRLRDDP